MIYDNVHYDITLGVNHYLNLQIDLDKTRTSNQVYSSVLGCFFFSICLVGSKCLLGQAHVFPSLDNQCDGTASTEFSFMNKTIW